MMRKFLIVGALIALSSLLPSCQLNVGEEVSNPKMGDITYTKDASGNSVAKADNTSGSNLEAQFLDDNKDPIGGRILVPAGTTATIPIPTGAAFIQIGEAPTPGPQFNQPLPSFSFYKILPPGKSMFSPGSGVNEASCLYADVEADPAAGDGWALSLSTFKILGMSAPVTTGTSIMTYILIEGDRSFQSGGPLSSIPIRITIADETLITDFEIYLDGNLIGDSSSPTATLQSGNWGSIYQAFTRIQPSLTWLNGTDLQVKYWLALDPTPKLVTLHFSTL
jgi:hypothetical protein